MAASSLVASPLPVEDIMAADCRRTLGLLSLDEKPIQVFVAIMGKDSSMLRLEVCKSTTIACVKLKIQADQGFCVNQQRLVYAGKELTKDECILQDYGIQNGDVLYLVLLIPKLVSLTLKPVDGMSFVYKVWQIEDIKDLQKFIFDTDGPLPLDLLDTVLKGEPLDAIRSLEELTLNGQFIYDLRVHEPNVHFRLVTSKEEDLVDTSAGVNAPLPGADLGVKPSGEERRIWPVTSKDGCLSVPYGGRDEQHLSYGLQRPARLSLPSRYPFSFDLPNSVWELFNRAEMGMNGGQVPVLTPEGSGGVYLMKDEYGVQNVAVFKPTDEEPMSANNPRGLSRSYSGEGLRKGTRSGEGAIREVAAFVLDHPIGSTKRTKADLAKREGVGFSGVPPTTLVRCYHEAFHYESDLYNIRKEKTGSLQEFVPAISSCEDMGSLMFPTDEVHKISVLDLRLANTDRNGGNILVCQGEDESIKLVPIDHGYCLPDKFEDCSFEWLYWPQAKQPYSYSTREYIKTLDADEDILLLRQCGWSLRPHVARNFRISTMVLKKGAAAGLTPFEIGSIMSRCGGLDTKSTIELIVEMVDAMNLSGHAYVSAVGELLDQHITSLKQ